MKSYLKIFFRAALIIFLLAIIYWAILSFKKIFEALDNVEDSGYSISSQDSSIISQQYWPKIKTVEVFNNKVRGPISLLLYDSLYHILFYKINLLADSPLSKIISVKKISSDVSNGVVYGTIGNDIIYNFTYEEVPIYPVRNIYLNVYADSLKLISNNENLLMFHADLLQNLSIHFARHSAIDILIKGNKLPMGLSESFPINFAFLKKNKEIYFIIMTPIVSRPINPFLLATILNG